MIFFVLGVFYFILWKKRAQAAVTTISQYLTTVNSIQVQNAHAPYTSYTHTRLRTHRHTYKYASSYFIGVKMCMCEADESFFAAVS